MAHGSLSRFECLWLRAAQHTTKGFSAPLFEVISPRIGDIGTHEGFIDGTLKLNALHNLNILVYYGADMNAVTYDNNEKPHSAHSDASMSKGS